MTAPAWPVILGAVKSITAASSPYNLTSADLAVEVNATAGAVTVALPPAALFTGRLVAVKKIDATANAVTIDPSGAETIDGAATLGLSAQWQTAFLLSDGANWLAIATGSSSSSSATTTPAVVITVAASPYAFLATDVLVLADAVAGAIAVTLPSPALGRMAEVVKTDTGPNAVTLTTPSGVIGVGGAATYVMSVPGTALVLRGDGTNWQIV